MCVFAVEPVKQAERRWQWWRHDFLVGWYSELVSRRTPGCPRWPLLPPAYHWPSLAAEELVAASPRSARHMVSTTIRYHSHCTLRIIRHRSHCTLVFAAVTFIKRQKAQT